MDCGFVAVDDFHVNANGDADVMNLVALKCTVDYLNWGGGDDDGDDGVSAGVA